MSETKNRGDLPISSTDNPNFGLATAGENPTLTELRDTLKQIWGTPVTSNDALLQQAIECLDKSQGILPDENRASIYLGLVQRAAHVSEKRRPIVNRLMDTVDGLNIPADNKVTGFTRILGQTNVQQTDLAGEIIQRIKRSIPEVTNPDLLNNLLTTVRYFPKQGAEISGDIQQRLTQLGGKNLLQSKK